MQKCKKRSQSFLYLIYSFQGNHLQRKRICTLPILSSQQNLPSPTALITPDHRKQVKTPILTQTQPSTTALVAPFSNIATLWLCVQNTLNPKENKLTQRER